MSFKKTIFLTNDFNEHWYEDYSEELIKNKDYALTLEFSKENIRIDLNDNEDLIISLINPNSEIYQLIKYRMKMIYFNKLDEITYNELNNLRKELIVDLKNIEYTLIQRDIEKGIYHSTQPWWDRLNNIKQKNDELRKQEIKSSKRLILFYKIMKPITAFLMLVAAIVLCIILFKEFSSLI